MQNIKILENNHEERLMPNASKQNQSLIAELKAKQQKQIKTQHEQKTTAHAELGLSRSSNAFRGD